MPVLGTARMHQQQGWMADWVDATVAKGRALPWTLGADIGNGILARSKNGVTPKAAQAWHVWGNPTELYSEIPWFDRKGRSHPYNPETSDDIALQVIDLKARPPSDGPRGLCMPTSQVTVIPHPTVFPAADAPNTGNIPRHPLVIWLRHDALLQFGYADGRMRNVGWIPGITHSHDACIDGRFMTDKAARKVLYVCDLGKKDAANVWSGGRIARVDRMPGAEAVGGVPAEDPTKYVVTTLASAGYPTAVRSDETGAVYFIDANKGGAITKVPLGGSPATLCTLPGVFAMDYAHGKLYVMTNTSEVRIINANTGAVGPNLMPAQWVSASATRGSDFFTISVDANGTCGPVGEFSCSRVHTFGNTNCWQFSADGATVKFGNQIYSSGHSWQTVGNAYFTHELFGHYDWLGGKFHTDQAVRFVGGYANCPVGVLVMDPPYPSQTAVDYTAIWRGMKVICQGGPVDDKRRPSLTCLMSREGWSMFAGCSNDEIAEMPFDAAEAWIHGGYAGSFRRDDIVGDDLYCVMLFHLVNSQRHIREGSACVSAFRAWWTGLGRAIPKTPAAVVSIFTADPAGAYKKDGNGIPYHLEVRETAPGTYRIGIFGNGSSDTKYLSYLDYSNNAAVGPVPSDAVIVVDQGMPGEVTLPAALAPGWHAFTVRAAGWATNTMTYFVPSVARR
jgi:hypothetical protein